MSPADQRAELDTARALFDGARLTQARNLAGLLKTELADRVPVTAAAIGQFESGHARPTIATLGQLALALKVPPMFFAANRPRFHVEETEAHFRSLRSTSKKDRARARAQVEILAEIVASLESQVRLPEIALPSIDPRTDPAEAARDVRAAWQLGDGPLANVVGLLERKGVVVARLTAATEELDAFSCWIGLRPFVVLVMNKAAADRSRFDASHELGHLVLHHDALPGDPTSERIAHAFAAEFLAPEAAMRIELPPRVDWARLAQIKLRWGVSIAMLLRRMRDLDISSDVTYRRAMMELSRRGWRRTEPVDLGQPEEPELLARALALLQERRGFHVADLARDVALRPEALAPYLAAFAGDARESLSL